MTDELSLPTRERELKPLPSNAGGGAGLVAPYTGA